MKNIFLSSLLTLMYITYSISSLAADQSRWYEGVVVLENKEVLNGELSINQKYNVLRIRWDKKIRSIPAHDIVQVRIYDRELEALRTFIVTPQNLAAKMNYTFYELVIQGEIKLLARDRQYKYVLGEQLEDLFQKITPSARNFVKDQNFFFFDGKNVVPLEKFKKLVLPAFRKYFNEEINSYIKSERLNTNLPTDQIKIMKYFNELYNEKWMLAKKHLQKGQ